MCSLDNKEHNYASFADQQRYSSISNYDLISTNYTPISRYRNTIL